MAIYINNDVATMSVCDSNTDFNFLKAMAQSFQTFGINAEEAADAIIRLNELLYRVNSIETDVDIVKTTADRALIYTSHLQDRIDGVQDQISDIRPELDALTEESKRKSDLKIFGSNSEIEFDTINIDDWYFNFLKELEDYEQWLTDDVREGSSI